MLRMNRKFKNAPKMEKYFWLPPPLPSRTPPPPPPPPALTQLGLVSRTKLQNPSCQPDEEGRAIGGAAVRTANEVWRIPSRAQSSWVQRTRLSGTQFVLHVAALLP